MIKKVINKSDAIKCDSLLNKLILDEKKYDNTINENVVIKNYFENIINNPKYYLLGCYIENELVGYILIKWLDSDLRICVLDGLYVEDEYRNQGIANSLIKEAINVCREYDYKHIDINVMYKNELAKKIYKKLGFEEFRINLRKDI